MECKHCGLYKKSGGNYQKKCNETAAHCLILTKILCNENHNVIRNNSQSRVNQRLTEKMSNYLKGHFSNGVKVEEMHIFHHVLCMPASN